MTAGFTWQTPPEEAFGTLTDAYLEAVKRLVYAVLQRRAPEIENWMKIYAPWTDRTGNARQTLHTFIDPPQTMGLMAEAISLVLSHGMDYGFWLEVKNAGRYAIVSPAIDHWAPIIIADLQRWLR